MHDQQLRELQDACNLCTTRRSDETLKSCCLTEDIAKLMVLSHDGGISSAVEVPRFRVVQEANRNTAAQSMLAGPAGKEKGHCKQKQTHCNGPSLISKYFPRILSCFPFLHRQLPTSFDPPCNDVFDLNRCCKIGLLVDEDKSWAEKMAPGTRQSRQATTEPPPWKQENSAALAPLDQVCHWN